MKNQITNSVFSRFFLEPEFRIGRYLLLQLIIFIISTDLLFDTPDKLNISINRAYGWFLYFVFLNLIISVNIGVLVPRFLLKNKLLHYLILVILLIASALCLMIVLQNYFYDIGIVHQEPNAITLFLNMASSILTICFMVIGTSSLLLFKQWISNNNRIRELQSATLQSELNFLKSQINPHFLFNMLNNANIMVDEDPDMASKILVKLDDLLRYQMNDSTRDKVYLSADILFLTDFLDLEKTRRDNFSYTILKEGDVNNVEVSPLLFIVFVENAIKHNSDSENLSYVNISFKVQNNKLTFVCENSKPLQYTPKKDGGLGLLNIKRRLDLLYAHKHSLQVKETEISYTVNLELEL